MVTGWSWVEQIVDDQLTGTCQGEFLWSRHIQTMNILESVEGIIKKGNSIMFWLKKPWFSGHFPLNRSFENRCQICPQGIPNSWNSEPMSRTAWHPAVHIPEENDIWPRHQSGDSFMFDSFSANMMLQTNNFMLETRNIQGSGWKPNLLFEAIRCGWASKLPYTKRIPSLTQRPLGFWKSSGTVPKFWWQIWFITKWFPSKQPVKQP